MRSRWFAFMALLFVLAGCSGPEGERGVGMEEISTDVGLGVEVNLDAAPANVVVRKPVRRFELPQNTLPPFETAAPTPGVDCDRAGPFDFAAVDAGVDPDPKARPTLGSYRWKLDGTVITDGGDQKVDEFETRVIKDLKDDTAAPGAYTFKMTQTRLFDNRPGTGTLETTYRVIPTGNFRSVPNPPAGPTVSDQGRGLYLIGTHFTGTNEDNEPTESTFEPTSPLLLLPFPVRDGTSIDASGTDPQTGMQITIAGAIKGKKQIDACGSRVDSWFVDATQTIRVTNPDTLQTETFEANYDYSVNPQYGSMLMYENIQAPKDGPIVNVRARIGRVPKRSYAQ